MGFSPCVLTVSVKNEATPVSGAVQRYQTDWPLWAEFSLNSDVAAVLSPATQPSEPEIDCASAHRSFGCAGCVKEKPSVKLPVAPFLPSTAIRYSVPAVTRRRIVLTVCVLVAVCQSSFAATSVSALTDAPV